MAQRKDPWTQPGRTTPFAVANRDQGRAHRKTLVFLAGYRRSGTTALQEQIAAHPDIHYFSGITRNEFHLFDLFERDRSEYAALVEAHTGQAPSFDIVRDAEAVFAGCRRPFGLVKSTRLLLGAGTWARFARWASRTEHEVVLLSIVRFPLDAISSDITRDSPELPPERRAQPMIPDARVACPRTAQEVWCAAYRRAVEHAGFVSRSGLVRLEDIVADPATTCTGLTRWLGLATPLVPREWKALHWGRWRDDPAFAGFRPSSEFVELAGRFGYRVDAAVAGRKAG